MIKYKVMLHEWKHQNKSQLIKFTPGIKNNIINYPMEVTLPELGKLLMEGHTTILGHLEYTEKDKTLMREEQKSIGASSRHWKSQQLFAVDVDNDNHKEGDPLYLSIDKAMALCMEKKVIPGLVYKTYSHTDAHHKFRMIFQADVEVTTLDHRKQIVDALFEVFAINGECLVDPKCVDPARLFFPGKEIVYENYKAFMNTSDMIKRLIPSYKLPTVSTSSSPAVTSRKTGRTYLKDNQMLEVLRREDFKTAKEMIADFLRQGPKHWRDWVIDLSDTGGTVTILYIIKAYCSPFIEHPSNPVPMRVTEDLKNPAFLRELRKPVFIRSSDEYYDIISRFPWHIVFEKELNQHFSCLLPGHHDSEASARFEQTENGEYIYHCYGCQDVSQYYDIFNFLEHAVGWTHAKAKQFINYLFNVEFETPWQKEKKEDITLYEDYLMGDQFKKNFPFLYSELLISRSFGILHIILGEARRSIYDKMATKTDDPVFFMGVRRLQEKAYALGIKDGISLAILHKKVKFLTKLELIRAVDDKDLPSDFLKEAHKIRSDKGYRYRINAYIVPTFSLKVLTRAENIAREMKALRIKRKNYDRQAELWAGSKETADKQFVQDKNIGKSRESIEFYEKYSLAAEDLLKKGYTTESELLAHKRVRMQKKKKELSATVMPQLLQEKDLQVVKYTKYYKALFGINQESLKVGRSNIIVRTKDIPEE